MLSVLTDGKKEVQNRVQIAAELARTESHEGKGGISDKPHSCINKPQKTIACDSMRDTGLAYSLGDTGLEPVASRVWSVRSNQLS